MRRDTVLNIVMVLGFTVAILGGIWALTIPQQPAPKQAPSGNPCLPSDYDCQREYQFDKQFGEDRTTALGSENLWGESVAAGLAIAGAGGFAAWKQSRKKPARNPITITYPIPPTPFEKLLRKIRHKTVSVSETPLELQQVCAHGVSTKEYCSDCEDEMVRRWNRF